jgi:hypothetical protein
MLYENLLSLIFLYALQLITGRRHTNSSSGVKCSRGNGSKSILILGILEAKRISNFKNLIACNDEIEIAGCKLISRGCRELWITSS